MINVIAPIIVAGFIVLLVAAYLQSRKTRQELISEMKEEILSNEPAPVEPPAPVVANLKEVAAEVKNQVEALTKTVKAEAEATKAEVKEMIVSQEAPVEKPKSKRRRGRPANKKQDNSTK